MDGGFAAGWVAGWGAGEGDAVVGVWDEEGCVLCVGCVFGVSGCVEVDKEMVRSNLERRDDERL